MGAEHAHDVAMLNIVLLNDHPMVLKALEVPLTEAGHRVLADVSPIDWDAVVRFKPQVIVAGISRSREAAGRPIASPAEDVIGYRALMDLRQYPAITAVPIVIVGMGIVESELPVPTHYDLFLYFPDDMETFVPRLEEVTHTIKRRRLISGYRCPNPGCGSRLTYTREREHDLFCPKCGSAVAVLDDDHAIWRGPRGQQEAARMGELRVDPPAVSLHEPAASEDPHR
ncbi:hypothetical protein D3C72_736440 [compost metagenome]